MSMQYELVLQFALAPRDVTRYERVTRFEEELMHAEGPYRVEGCDCALGSMLLRLSTDDPDAAFASIRDKLPNGCPYDVRTKELTSVSTGV